MENQEEPGRKGTNIGQEQPMITHIKGEDRGRKEGSGKPRRTRQKGTNIGQEQPIVTHINGEDRKEGSG